MIYAVHVFYEKRTAKSPTIYVDLESRMPVN